MAGRATGYRHAPAGLGHLHRLGYSLFHQFRRAVFDHVQQLHVALDGGLVTDLFFSLAQVKFLTGGGEGLIFFKNETAAEPVGKLVPFKEGRRLIMAKR